MIMRNLKSSAGLLAFVAFLVIPLATADDYYKCVQGENCRLPDCFCATFSHPLGAQNIPQVVYFGFDDAVTPPVAAYFDQLFTNKRLNPNGCPITMSLYVSDHYTKYNIVRDYYKRFDEIAVHSVTHSFITTADKLRKEATKERNNIVTEAGVPFKDVVGWRSPNLATAGDDQPKILKQLNYTYDISLPYEADHRIPFPFTLDYGYPYPCTVSCPKKDNPHKGFWEVTINDLIDPVSKIRCTYVDSCRPTSEDAAYEFLMYNFLRSYNGERSPMGLNMHAAWFFFPQYLNATHRFLDTLLQDYSDVYIISVKQMLAWMKTPVDIDESKTFQPWGCQKKQPEVNLSRDKVSWDSKISSESRQKESNERATLLSARMSDYLSSGKIHHSKRIHKYNSAQSLLSRPKKKYD